jgi:hypothetical protein
MREFLVFLDEPAAAAVGAVAAFLSAHGLTITHRSRLSASFAGPEPPSPGSALRAAAADERACPAPSGAGTLDAAATDTRTPVGRHSAGAGTLPDNAGQVAAVPVQRRAEWCRLWVTVTGDGAAAAAVEAYVAAERDRSRRVEAAVQQLERDIYAEAQWPAYEATLRASLRRQGIAAAAVDAKIAAFKRRWLALGRKAAAAAPEEAPPSA